MMNIDQEIQSFILKICHWVMNIDQEIHQPRSWCFKNICEMLSAQDAGEIGI